MTYGDRNLKSQEQKFFFHWLIRHPHYWWKHVHLLRNRYKETQFRKRGVSGQNTMRYYSDEVRAAVLILDLPLKVDYDWYHNLPWSGWREGDGPSLFEWQVPLAQSKCLVEKAFDGWSDLWPDQEDTFAFNRFIWLLRWLTLRPKAEHLREAFFVIRRWISEMQDRKDHLAWSPYTVCERLINWLIFLCCSQKDSPLRDEDIELLRDSLADHVAYLVFNLEYFPEGKVSNHILNNARALYIGGRLMRLSQVSYLGEMLFRMHTPELVGSNGFLLEGSSHYQLLLTRTFTEVLLFAHLTGDRSFEGSLRARCKKMQRACTFFYVGNGDGLRDFPRIGDCSPDVPVDWFFPNLGIMSKQNYSWAKLWAEIQGLKGGLLEEEGQFCNSKSTCDGWLRVTHKKWIIIALWPAFQAGYPANHGHLDFGSFVLFHDGVPLFVDRGRYSYELPVYQDYGLSAFGHNTVTVEDIPVVPIAKGLLTEYGRGIIEKSKMNISENGSGFGVCWESEGFKRVVPNLHWRREISYRNESVQISDCFTGSSRFGKKGKLKIRFHLDPKAVVLNHKEGMLIFSIEGKEFCFQTFIEGNQDNVLHKSISCMDEDHYPDYGKRETAKTIEITMVFSGECKVLSVVGKT